jgi:feruloyl esterase
VPQFNGGWLSPAKVRTLAKFVSDSCDALDNLADGVVNNYLACPSRVSLQQLRCVGGIDTGDTCLSDAQIATVTAVHTPHDYAFPLANGLTSYPQWLYGNESSPDTLNGVSTVGGLPLSTMTRWVTGTATPTAAVNATTDAQQWLYGANFVRYFITKNPSFDPLSYDANAYQARVQAVSEIIDSSNPVAAKLGAAAVEQSARLYISPASNHSGTAASVTDGSSVPTMVDLLDPLDRWASAGQAPADSLEQTLKATTPPFALQASRPMCRYPNYPRYVGGDVKQAASYTCAASQL